MTLLWSPASAMLPAGDRNQASKAALEGAPLRSPSAPPQGLEREIQGKERTERGLHGERGIAWRLELRSKQWQHLEQENNAREGSWRPPGVSWSTSASMSKRRGEDVPKGGRAAYWYTPRPA